MAAKISLFNHFRQTGFDKRLPPSDSNLPEKNCGFGQLLRNCFA
jgi:hypothetical protein